MLRLAYGAFTGLRQALTPYDFARYIEQSPGPILALRGFGGSGSAYRAFWSSNMADPGSYAGPSGAGVYEGHC